jgi:hypothetical protein
MKRWIFAVAIAAVASTIVAATASADVSRNQPTATLVVSLTDAQPGNQHTFTITNPSGTDGAFAGTGQGNTAAGGATETISGNLVGDHLTFTAIYDQSSFWPGYTWSYNGPLDGAPLGDSAFGYHATATVTPINAVQNHGDYVSSQGGGSAAAHSPIGMPLNSKSGK